MSKPERERRMGWEVAQDLERSKTTIRARIMPEWRHVKAALGALAAFGIVYLIGVWLAGNPFDATQRIPSEAILEKGWAGTDNWGICWKVVFLAMIFEFMDASAGMGFGTALTPLLLLMGFDPKQIVPVVMVQQGVAGIVGAFLHREFENVEWRLKPVSETVRLWMIIAIAGTVAIVISITAVYGVFSVAKVWIKLYVAILLLGMGAVSLMQARKIRPYRPMRMVSFAALAGFNKGVGGGGYGPVVTIGGLMSGVPVKSMLAVTAISEGTVSAVAIVVWLAMLTSGVTVDYVLLPSMMLATMFSAVAAPYMTRVLPEKIWKFVVPFYCVVVAGLCIWKIVPDVIDKLAG